jgi:transmembrane sensor
MTRQERLSATEIDLLAADWLQRRHLWTWTQANQAELDIWLAASEAHHIAYLRQSAVWSTAGRLTALRTPMRPNSTPPNPRRWIFLRSVAAAAIVAAIGFAAMQYLSRTNDTTYVTPIGGHEVVTLADGTRIELNTDTALRIRRGADSRGVTLLRGEAYFEVHHDAAHPFAVTASTYRITDLGTKFSVRASSGAIKVSLLEGSAVVAPLDAARSSRSALLWPGDVAIADAKKLVVEKKSVPSLSTALGWRRGVLIFKDTELADAAAEFNRYNTRKIRVEDGAIAHLKINGTFQAENSELFASSVQELFGLRAGKIGNDTTLSH